MWPVTAALAAVRDDALRPRPCGLGRDQLGRDERSCMPATPSVRQTKVQRLAILADTPKTRPAWALDS